MGPIEKALGGQREPTWVESMIADCMLESLITHEDAAEALERFRKKFRAELKSRWSK